MAARCMASTAITAFWMSLLLGSGPAVVSVDDVLVRDDESVVLTAYVEREVILGMRKDVEHVSVTFSAGDRTLGQTVSGDEGLATLSTTLPAGQSALQVEANVHGQAVKGVGRVFRWNDNRVIIAVDVDQTVSQTDWEKLVTSSQPAGSLPLPGAQETLSGLAKDYHILYLTSRPRFLLDRTRDWLSHFEFPAGPVITAPGMRGAVMQSRFKRGKIAELRQVWPRLLIGIGNRQGDAVAYASNHMLPLILASEQEDEQLPGSILFRDWAGIREFFDVNRKALVDPGEVVRVIRGERTIHQPVVPWGSGASTSTRPATQPGG